MTVQACGGRNKADAIKAARAITLSPLWQCALAGGDPNWGRIVAALGASGCELNPATYEIFIGDVQVTKQGMGAQYDQDAARKAMAGITTLIKSSSPCSRAGHLKNWLMI